MEQPRPVYRRRPGNVVLRRARLEPEVVRVRQRRRWRVVPRAWMVVVAFAAVMAGGGALLSLRIAAEHGVEVGFFDGLFTAVSAVSVTGLTRFDTADTFSWFGEAVTLVLMQLGGLGVTMYAGILILIAGRRLGMRGRQFFGMELAGSGSEVAGAPRLLRRVMLYTVAAELATFLLLLPWFVAEFGGGRSVWMAFYHAVSAFNNAGFDVMGAGQGINGQADDGYPVVVMGIAALVGSLSFLTIFDLPRGRRRWTLDTRVVLWGMGGLLVLGMLVFILAEWSGVMSGQSPGSRVINGFFLSVNRTTGMSTAPIDQLGDGTTAGLLPLMLIGGASTSTASGIKIGSFMISIFAVVSALRGRGSVVVFGREVPPAVVIRAFAVVMLGLTTYAAGAAALMAIESQLSPLSVAFDAMSALANVGWSQGVANAASSWGAYLLMALMFVGRLGPMLVALAIPDRPHDRYRHPSAPVRIG